MNYSYPNNSEERAIALAELDVLRRKPLLSVPQAARRGELPGLVTVNGRMHVRTAMLVGWLDGHVLDGIDAQTNRGGS